MDCHHFALGECRSCAWLPRPYAAQLSAKQERTADLLAGVPGAGGLRWKRPHASAESEFRNKAKMVVTGTAAAPVLGILGPGGGPGVDLRDCGLYEPAVRRALPGIADFVGLAAITPYDLGRRHGELKLVLVTATPGGALLVRFVCRSQEPVARVRKHLSRLVERLPAGSVVSVNLQPEHKAVIEGATEIVLTERGHVVMAVNGHDLLLRPRSFFQTNTEVAAALYRQAVVWVGEPRPEVGTVWDLYCGVGGFALHLAGRGRAVVGVETSADAVASAEESARRGGMSGVGFVAADAVAWATEQPEPAELVVVNPPRRGLGPALSGWLDRSGVRRVLYSSCNPESLARDLTAMPGMRPMRGRVFDMFPHTAHAEVLVELERR